MRRHRRSLELQSDLNLTNLLDTAFILLIAFMLVAPMLKHGIELELPEVSRGELTTSSNTITIVIDRPLLDGEAEPIYVEDQRLTLDELRDLLERRLAEGDTLSVVVEGDRRVSYESVSQVLGVVKNVGVRNVGLATQPESLQ